MSTQRVTLTPATMPAPPEPVEHHGRPLVILEEPGLPARARVVGALTGDAVRELLAAVESGFVRLDLSLVDDIDEAAVRVLAGLLPRRCTLIASPRWLELWLGHVRWSSVGAAGRGTVAVPS